MSIKYTISYLIAGIVISGFSAVAAHAQNPNCKVRDQDVAAIYKGGCKDGLANGQGLAKGRDTFEGEFKDGDKVKGKYTWGPTACKSKKCIATYNGEWKDDTMDGYGEAEYSDGDTYKGQWKKGKKVGLTKSEEKEQADACSKKEFDYVKSKCGSMTTDNFQCIMAKKQAYASLCGGKKK